MSRKNILKILFCSSEHDNKSLTDEANSELIENIWDIASEEYNRAGGGGGGDESDDEFDDESEVFKEKIEATKKNFDKIVKLFQETRKGRSHFLKNFQIWSPKCKEIIEMLRKLADEIHSDKFNRDIVTLVGTLVCILGGIALGISYATPAAVVTVPLTIGGEIACGLGGIAVAGTGLTQIALLRTKLNEAKKNIERYKDDFSLIADWFSMPEELKKAIDSLVNYSILKEAVEDFKKFIADVKRENDITIGDFKIRFKEFLKFSMQKILECRKLREDFGDELAPAVMTFIVFFCILNGENRTILDCMLINEKFALCIMSILNIGVPARHLVGDLAAGAAEFGDDFFIYAFSKFFLGITLAIDLISFILNCIEVHKCPEPEQTKQLMQVAKQIEEMFLAIENVYNKTKEFESAAPKKWTSVFVKSVPDDAGNEDIKMAFESFLPDSMKDYITFKRMNQGKNLIVNVPEGHSELLLLQSTLLIKGQHCEISI